MTHEATPLHSLRSSYGAVHHHHDEEGAHHPPPLFLSSSSPPPPLHSTTQTWSQRFTANVWGGIKQNAIPGLILQCIALGLVVGYYYVDALETEFGRVARLKDKYGYLFSAISTALFGGFIPWIILTTRDALRDRRDGRQTNWRLAAANGLFFTLMFMERGVEIDAFYQFQSWLWGNNTKPSTIIKKMLFDQFVYTVFLAAPVNMLLLLWKDSHFSWNTMRKELDITFLTFRYPCGLVTGWMVWIPAVSLVYLLPGALQVPLFNLVLCFFVLLLAFVSEQSGKPAKDTVTE